MTSTLGDDIGIVLYTPAGAFEGALHVPHGATVLEHLNRAPEHLRLVGARFDGDPQTVPFLALRRDSVICVMTTHPQDLERLAPRAGEGRQASVAGILSGFRFQGTVSLPMGQRVTDFFGTAPSFIAVRDCSLLRAHAGQPEAAFAPGVALIRADAVVAFSDTLS